MELGLAAQHVLEGSSLQQIEEAFRAELVAGSGLRADEVTPDTFRGEVDAFMRSFARHLGDRHVGEARIGEALRDWVSRTDHYEAWDALLSGFEVQGREALVRRGRMMFPGPLTAHWAES